MAKVDVTTQIEIARPIKLVADFVADPNNVPDWHENITAVEVITETPTRIGSRVAIEGNFMGRELAYTYEIIKFDQYEKLVMKATDGPFPMETCYMWESLADSLTRMTLSISGEPSGVPNMMVPFVTKMLKQSNQNDLELLKEILEYD